jgi:uncharacterized glyoxalase superfamily protein PhnB
MTRLKQIIPVLRVHDMQRSIDFYCDVLKFELLWRSPDDAGAEVCMLQSGATALMLSTGSQLGDKPSFTGTLYFDMDGVATFYEQVKNQVEIVWPLETMDYGTLEFGLRDPDGYTLAFSEDEERPA